MQEILFQGEGNTRSGGGQAPQRGGRIRRLVQAARQRVGAAFGGRGGGRRR